MALHPFRTFRKHQKVVWSFLVILCMITFVFMSGTGGRGDIFGRLSDWVASSKRGGPPVTTLYGQTVNERGLMDLRRQRTLANQALSAAAGLAAADVQRELQPLMQDQNKMPNPKEPGFENFVRSSKLRGELEQLQQQQFRNFFESQSLGKTEELLDFLVWRHQADKLGIQLTADDVDAELKRSTSGRTGLSAVAAELAKASRQPITDDQMREDVRKALADEYRVDMAQEALLSYDPSPREPVSQFTQPTKQIPAPVTPYEFWTYYQKQRTALDVALVPLPVEVPSGVSANGQEPNDDILQAMFNRYKDQEARPDQAQPGFKIPRRIKVGWVRADPGSEAYQKAAGETVQASRVALGLAAGGNASLTGLPVVADPYFLNEYYTLKITGRFDMAGLTQPDFPLSLYAARVHPENAAAALGEVTAAAAQGTPFGALALYQAGLVQANTKDMEPLVKEEAKSRVPFGVSLLLAGAGSGTLAPLQGAMTSAGLVAYGDRTTQSLPMAAVQDQVVGSVRAALTRELAAGDLKAFQKEMDNQRSRGGNVAAKIKAVEGWLPKGIKDYHLEASSPMKEALDQFEIAKAPALEPLQDALLREPGQTPAKAEEEMSAALFKDEGAYRPLVWPPSPAQFGQQPAPVDANSFLVWRTEEKPAYVPKSRDEVKAEVEAAWRLSRGRLATRDAAEKLKAELAKAGGDQARVRQTAAENHREVIELTGVAREVPETVAVATGHRYQPYHFPDAIRYPGKDWVEQLLDRLRTKGEAHILADQPEKTFYVAVLLERHEPSIHNFYDIYRDAAVSFTRDQLLDQLVQEKRTKYREEFVKALRVEATPDQYKDEVAKTGKFRLDPEYTKDQEKRRGTSGRGGEEEGEE